MLNEQNTHSNIDAAIDAADFSDRPIHKAVENALIFLNGDDMAATAKAPVYLINDILEEDAHGIIYGASMTYKTFFALSIAHSICTGRPFMGRKVKKTGRVLYICGEGEGAMGRRLKAQIIGNNQGFNNNFYSLKGTIRIDNDDDMKLLRNAIAEINPVFVMIDTFASLVSTAKENDNGDVGRVLRLIKETCRNGITSSMVVHHCGKDEGNGARGAYAFTGNTDFNIELTRTNKAMLTTATCHKMKEGAEFEPFSMKAEVISLGIYDDDMNEATSLILRQSDYEPAKDRKSLDSEYRKVLNILQSVIDDDGIEPPKSVIDLFPDNKNKAPKKVTSIKTWLNSSLDVITVICEPEKEKHTKRVKFDRVRKKLDTLGHIGIHGDFVWIANAPQPA